MTFANAIKNQPARTTNGMKARKSSANACVDLFYNIGASRGRDIIPHFAAAYAENSDLALRIAQWARDVRGGSGERELFRQILKYLETHAPLDAALMLKKVPEIGRWDDIFVFETAGLKGQAYTMLGDALRERNGLAAKWTPRKGQIAREIREFFGMTPKFYRKSLVALTNVVEQKMCAQQWDDIEYSHVPSLAHSRYKKAFGRHGTTYADYIQRLVKGEVGVKVNAGAVYPYDVLKGRIGGWNRNRYTADELALIEKQWEALPNYIGDARVLPLVDVSGSMTCRVGGIRSRTDLTCLEVAVSLGLYFADKNLGKFKDCFLTFTSTPKLLHLTGNINQKIDQMVKADWGGSTNLHLALDKILETAKAARVPQSEMPESLIVFSDMQFDTCMEHDDSAMEMIARKYHRAGYVVPRVVFWNLNAQDNTPVAFDASGTALVSGFSPAIAGSILSGNLDDFTPEAIMLKAVMTDRYKLT